MHKFAGVTLDYYDDKGETLLSKFPTVSAVPDIIKRANVQDKEKVANEQFALIALDGGHVLRKYACTDAGTTAMSVIYFLEHGDKLPEDAVKMAATNLVNSCIEYGILPPEELTKQAYNPLAVARSAVQGAKTVGKQVAGRAGGVPGAGLPGVARAGGVPGSIVKGAMPKTSSVDIIGQRPKAKLAAPQPVSDEDYAVTSGGRRMYPIHDWDHVKVASDYWLEQRIRMAPEVRREYATKLASKAKALGFPLDNQIKVAGAKTFADPGHVKAAMEMRKVAYPRGAEERVFLEELFEKRASVGPAVYAECLRRFDMEQGFQGGWDSVVLDPWASTFGKEADTVVWEDGADRVTASQLHNLAVNHSGDLDELFTEFYVKEFLKDPTGIFNSLPDPQKRRLARLADNMAHNGGSEGQIPITASSSVDADKSV